MSTPWYIARRLRFACEAAAVVAAVAVARIGALQAEQGFLVAPAAAIDGHRDREAARLLGARHDGLGDVPLVGGIELVPDRRAARGGHLLDAGGRRGRQDLQVVAGLRRPGDRDLALRVERPFARRPAR